MNLRGWIARIRQRVTVHDVCERYGVSFRPTVRCPFPDHPDNSPSCILRRDYFHCYGCGRRGDAIDFVAGMEDCDTAAAVRWIAREFRLNIPDTPEGLRDALASMGPKSKRWSMAEREVLWDEMVRPLVTVWEAYQWCWGEWSIEQGGFWEAEVWARERRLRRWWSERDDWPEVELRAAVDQLIDWAVAWLTVQHEANVYRVEATGERPEPLPSMGPITDPAELDARWAAAAARVVRGLVDMGVPPVDALAVVDPESARLIRLRQSVGQIRR